MQADDALQSVITDVLRDAETTGSDPVDRLTPLVYDRLRAMAHGQLRRERADHTLATTDLVHEAYLKLADSARLSEQGRTYFLGAAARAMRQILVDYARRRQRQKRGGGQAPVPLDENQVAARSDTDILAADLIDLDTALEKLAELDARQARVVECRFFGGLSVEETASVVGVSSRTVKGDWAVAKAWLYRALGERTSF
ncbi:MAG: ECF-type sigma factor [Rhodothermales bacterium]